MVFKILKTKICQNCQKEFTSKSPNSKFCCSQCQKDFLKKEKHPAVKKVCPTCQKEFETFDYKQNYCCENCRYENSRKKKLKDKTTRICLNCGKVFETSSIVKKFCCKDCQEIYTSKIKFKDAKDAIICKECGLMANNIIRHIPSKHNMTVEEYCKKHNCTRNDLISESSHKNISETQKRIIAEGKKVCFTSENNPSKGEDCKNGRNSPYSMNFRGYDGLTEEEKENKIKELKSDAVKNMNERNNNSLSIDYYLAKGMSTEEAKKALKERQSTFSLEKCIEKYGEEEGKKKWLERQEKWQNTLNSKSDEEKKKINLLKLKGIINNKNYSKISQDLFWKVYEKIKQYYINIYFATLHPTLKIYDDKSNYEYIYHRENGSHFFFDFFIEDTGKIIEFDGDYWHGEKRGNKKREEERDRELFEYGYDILRVKERDYRKNPEKVIQECIDFLNSDNH